MDEYWAPIIIHFWKWTLPGELGWLEGKTVFVQRTETNEYVDIGSLVCSISRHPKLQQIAHPACSLVALYVLSGCDYTSSFYGCTKQRFLDTFMDNISYICAEPSGSLFSITEGTCTIPQKCMDTSCNCSIIFL